MKLTRLFAAVLALAGLALACPTDVRAEAGFYVGGAQAVAETREGFAAGADTVRRGGVAYIA